MKGEFAKANEIFKDVIKKDNVKPIVYRLHQVITCNKVSADSVESARVSEEFIAKAKTRRCYPKGFDRLG